MILSYITVVRHEHTLCFPWYIIIPGISPFPQISYISDHHNQIKPWEGFERPSFN